MSAQPMESFDELRPLLLAIGYRMLGSAADAEDLVQEAYLRWQRADQSAVESPKGYLTAVVTRLCIDHLRSARVRRERPVVELPEPVGASSALSAVELANSLSVAFLVILQRLSPTERAVFLLREVFDHDYPEIAAIVGKSEAACRQIVSRARGRIQDGRARFAVEPAEVEPIIRAFAAACDAGDLDQLLALLAPDVVLYADGGDARPAYGRARAIGKPLEGAAAVARFLISVQGQAPADAVGRVHEINGAPALLSYVGGELQAVLSFDIVGGEVRAIFVNADPDKLAGLGSLRTVTEIRND